MPGHVAQRTLLSYFAACEALSLLVSLDSMMLTRPGCFPLLL
jgi:hypothetical protein